MTARLPRSLLVAFACLALASSLGGCGRKGPLDLPPTAANDPTAVATGVLEDDDAPIAPAAQPQATDSPQVAAAKARKRRIILDNLLD